MGIDLYSVLVNRKSAVAIKEKSGVDFDILYDENLAVSKKLGIFHKSAVPVLNDTMARRMNLDDVPIIDKKADLPQPAVFLFDANGKIIWSYVSTNYRIRPDTMDMLVAAEEHFGN